MTLRLLPVWLFCAACAAPPISPPDAGPTDAGEPDRDGGEGDAGEVDAGPLRFTEVSAAAGVTYVQGPRNAPPDCLLGLPGAQTGTFCETEAFAGGAAAADFDGDGWIDLYATRIDGPDLLFRNRGDGTFEDVAAQVGLTLDLPTSGAGWGDLDNDGDPDLYVTTVSDERFYLFMNEGGRFTEEAEARGLAQVTGVPLQGFTVAFGDYDNDGWLDVHTSEWRFVIAGDPDAPSAARLFRNRGAAAPGHFEDVTAVAGVAVEPTVFVFTSHFVDLDRDGFLDLAVTADFDQSRLFWNRGDGTFLDGTAAAGVGTDENGMGAAFGDVDGDGLLDWFVTSIHDADETCRFRACGWAHSGNRLYRNNGDRTFDDRTDLAGVRAGGWGWGTAFLDFDNDGRLDLAMTNGFWTAQTDLETPFLDDPQRLWWGGVRPMPDVAPAVGFDDRGQGRALITFDYDADGDLDIFVARFGDTPRLYRNDGGHRGGWLRVQALTATGGDAFGAEIRVVAREGAPAQVRAVGTSSGFQGHGERIAHFGLGEHDGPVHEVRVRWPGGGETLMREVSPRQVLTVRK